MWRGAWGCLGWLAAPGGEGFLGGSVGLRGCLESGGGLGGWFGCRREGVGELTGVGGGFVALRWWCYGGLSLCKGLAVGVWWSLGWWVWGVVLVGGSGVVEGVVGCARMGGARSVCGVVRRVVEDWVALLVGCGRRRERGELA